MTEIRADVIGGVYVMRWSPSQTNVMAYSSNPVEFNSLPVGMIKHLDDVTLTNGVSLGCTLIHKRVLENIVFKTDLPSASDRPFMEDCNKSGFMTVCDKTIFCGHIREDGTEVRPVE